MAFSENLYESFCPKAIYSDALAGKTALNRLILRFGCF